MASTGKKKTTMAKRDRENRLRARRLEKQAKKDARKLASAQDGQEPGGTPAEHQPEHDAEQSALDGDSSAVAGAAHQAADAS